MFDTSEHWIGNFTEDTKDTNQARFALLTVICSTLSLVTIAGNILVITSISLYRSLQTVSNTFVISLASADLIVGSFVLPLGAHYVIADKWLLGDAACRVWISVDVLSVTASIGTLSAIAVDRFISIKWPLQYHSKVTRQRTRFVIAVIWSVSCLMALLPIHAGWWKSSNINDIRCFQNEYCCEFFTNETFAIVSSLISFYIPVIILITAYSIVFTVAGKLRSRYLERTPRKIKKIRRSSAVVFLNTFWEKRERRTLLMSTIIIGVFIVCWLPFFVLNITQVFCNRCVPKTIFTVANWMGYANSFFNPFIYCHSKEFRKAFKTLLKCNACRQGYGLTDKSALSNIYLSSASAFLTTKRNKSQRSTVL